MPMSQKSNRGRKRSRSKSRSRSRGPSRTRTKSDDQNMLSRVVVPRAGMSSKNIFRFTRWCDVSNIFNTNDGSAGGTLVTSGLPDTIFQGVISLNQIPGTADFTNLFSQYKFTGLEYHLINVFCTEINLPANAALQVGNPSTNSYRNVAVYIGAQNDTLGTASIQQIQQEEGVVVRDLINQGKPLMLKIAKPTYRSSAVDTSGTDINTAVDLNTWLDTQTAAGVAYRGFYMGIQNAYSASTVVSTITQGVAQPMFSVRVKVMMEFRGVR